MASPTDSRAPSARIQQSPRLGCVAIGKEETARKGIREEGMKMIYLKACIKCRGDVALVNGIGGVYLQCLQCANTIETPEEAKRVLALKEQLSTAA